MLDDCDSRGDFRYCLQCGHYTDLPESADPPEEKPTRGAGTAYRRKRTL